MSVIKMKCNDQVEVGVPRDVAMQFEALKPALEMLEDADDDDDDALPLEHVPSNALKIIIDWCNSRVKRKPKVEDEAAGDSAGKDGEAGTDIAAGKEVAAIAYYDDELEDEILCDAITKETVVPTRRENIFLRKLKFDDILDVLRAANFLQINRLVDVGCFHVAQLMNGKSVEEMRDMFHIKNDFTPEEIETIKKENAFTVENEENYLPCGKCGRCKLRAEEEKELEEKLAGENKERIKSNAKAEGEKEPGDKVADDKAGKDKAKAEAEMSKPPPEKEGKGSGKLNICKPKKFKGRGRGRGRGRGLD